MYDYQEQLKNRAYTQDAINALKQLFDKEETKNLVHNKKWGKLFESAPFDSVLTGGILADFLLSIGVNPFTYLNTLNANCLFGSRLTSFAIPSSIKNIEKDAFSGCYALSKIMVPLSVTNITGYVFNFCPCMKDIIYQGTSEQFKTLGELKYWTSSWNSITVCCEGSNDSFLINI